jgi:hypothetical protein
MRMKKFKESLFEKGNNICLADEVECGDIICLSNNTYFYVFDLDKFFKEDALANIYADDDKVAPEHTVITFYNESDDEIYGIPGDAKVIVYKRVNGNYSNSPAINYLDLLDYTL